MGFAYLSPKAVTWLQELGLETPECVRKIGVVAVFQALARRHQGVTRRLLWALANSVRVPELPPLSPDEAQQLWREAQQGFPPLMPAERVEAETYMRMALCAAEDAALGGEVPVGAVVVRHGDVIGCGHNQPVTHHDPSAHAEIQALRQAASAVGNYRLNDAVLYVTLEPCPMCAGAILHSRMQRVVFGAYDERGGAAGSVVDLFAVRALNAHTAVSGGILEVESRALLQQFFRARR